MSELTITNVIVHEIKKEQQGVPSVLLSASCLANNDNQINQVVNRLCNLFKTKPLERAVFKNDSNFVRCTKNFQSNTFKDATEELVGILKNELVNATNAKGGFLVFFEHQQNSNDKFFSIFLLRNTTGFIFLKDEKIYKPAPTEYVNFEQVAMGARINLSKFLADSDERYIALVRGNTDISEYFKKWIGINRQESEKTDCKNLLLIANNIALPDNVKDRDALKKIIGDYARNSPNKRISLSGLSEHLYGDVNFIQKYAFDEDIEIDSEFTLKGKSLNKFFKVSVQADGIDFSANREYFNSKKIIIDGHKIIINSKELIDKIHEQL